MTAQIPHVSNIEPPDCAPERPPRYWSDLTSHEKALLTIYNMVGADPAYAEFVVALSEDEFNMLLDGTADIAEMVDEGCQQSEIDAYITRNYLK